MMYLHMRPASLTHNNHVGCIKFQWMHSNKHQWVSGTHQMENLSTSLQIYIVSYRLPPFHNTFYAPRYYKYLQTPKFHNVHENRSSVSNIIGVIDISKWTVMVFTELGREDDGKLFVCQEIRPKSLKIVGHKTLWVRKLRIR